MSKLEELEKKYKKLGEEIEQLKNEKLKTKLYDLVSFSGYVWYVIAEDDDKLTLFMKDKFTPEMCEKYFDKSLLDSDKDVKFAYNFDNIWWADSPIRMILNTKFLDDLEKNKLELMKTTVLVSHTSSITVDYVRLITKEEIDKLPTEISRCSGEWGYWTMSPSHFDDGIYACEMLVNTNGALISDNYVANEYGVRPVICVKKSEVKYE